MSTEQAGDVFTELVAVAEQVRADEVIVGASGRVGHRDRRLHRHPAGPQGRVAGDRRPRAVLTPGRPIRPAERGTRRGPDR